MGFKDYDLLSPHELRIHAAHVASLDFETIREYAAAIRCPTLVTWATDDAMIEDAIGHELAGAISTAEVLRFQNGGHNLQKSRVEELSSAIVDLYRRLTS
jgi:pimeloyl-ACP methyl ester carboxylesterase